MKLSFEETCASLRNHQVVAIATETVFGLAAMACDEEAISKIYALKNRPSNNPLIVHISNLTQLQNFVQHPSEEELFIASIFWPGPLTILFEAKSDISPILRANLPTVAIRMPKQPDMARVIDEVGPLVAPSANRSTRPSSTAIDHIESDFGKDFPIYQENDLPYGVESTIIRVEDQTVVVYRLGAISLEELQEKLPYPVIQKNKQICPGSFYKHYSPNAVLSIDKDFLNSCEAVIGFEEENYPKDKKIYLLGSKKNPSKVANNLYNVLRSLDMDQIKSAWVDLNFPDHGLFLTIKERLIRASNLKGEGYVPS